MSDIPDQPPANVTCFGNPQPTSFVEGFRQGWMLCLPGDWGKFLGDVGYVAAVIASALAIVAPPMLVVGWLLTL